MKRGLLMLAVLAMAAQLVLPITSRAATGNFTPDPQTSYASGFITKCGGQQWFINEVERLLNAEQKTLNTVTSSSDFSNIKSLGLKDKNITGSIPSAIGDLTNLEYLFLSGNDLSGDIPSQLYLLTKLKYIDLSCNTYSGSLPSEFGTMAALTTLVLNNNNYVGTIPSTILANTKITALDLSGNALTGGIPADINGMTSLQYLNLSGNALGGTIPDLSALSGLKSLSLWSCGLSGTIPDSLYTLTTLKVLDLSGNALTGEMSSGMSSLAALRYLSLASNKLHGTVPDVFVSTLETVHLEDNYLRGTIPTTLKARYNAGSKVYLDNNYMTGASLAEMTNNTGNFIDAVTAQYKLTATQTPVQISKTKTVDVYALLKNIGSGAKALLNTDEYTLIYDEAKIEATVTTSGIYVKALTDIPTSDGLKITVAIKGNDGSSYSKTEMQLTTDTVETGGDGGSSPTQKETHSVYINGYPDGTFRPEERVTREQMAKMIITALEINITGRTTTSYTDVEADSWSLPYIEEATESGYFTGYGDGMFKPESKMTRAELAACLVRIAEKRDTITEPLSTSFNDVPDGAWYAQYVKKASVMGFVKGYSDDTFRPDSTVTRAEAVTMVNRMLGRDPDSESELKTLTNPFTDVSSDHWAYLQILEASVTHEHEAQ